MTYVTDESVRVWSSLHDGHTHTHTHILYIYYIYIGMTAKQAGRVLVSLEAMPLAVAELRPAGFGRSEPNMNPVSDN